jgi:hypothetical protein
MVLSIKADESLPLAARFLIEDRGHEVRTALEEDLGGHSDRDLCVRPGRVLKES